MTTMLAPLTLEQELEALLEGEGGSCLACGAGVEVEPDGRVECAECGSVLEAGPAPRPVTGQLILM
jgi:hypothetical protein